MILGYLLYFSWFDMPQNLTCVTFRVHLIICPRNGYGGAGSRGPLTCLNRNFYNIGISIHEITLGDSVYSMIRFDDLKCL